MDKVWLIWSVQKRSWWAARHCGYVPVNDIDKAGRYTFAEADAICKDANKVSIDEIIVPSPELVEDLRKVSEVTDEDEDQES